MTTSPDASSTPSPPHPILVVGGTGKTGRRVAERLHAARRCRCASARVPATRPSTGRTARRGQPRCEGTSAAYVSFYPDLAVPGAPRGDRGLHRRRAGRRHAPARAALRSRRGGGPARRAGAAGLRRRLDDRALQLVLPELQRELLRRAAGLRRARPAGRRRRRAVRRRRGHRRRGGGGADAGRARRPPLRADRPAPADVRRGGAGDRPRLRPADRLRRRSRWRTSWTGWPSRRSRPTSPGCCGYLFGEVLDGRNAYLADGVQQALGRAPRDFADFARDAAAAGAWSATTEAA